MNQINFFQRREFGELVGVTFQFVKQNFVHYFVNVLLLNLPLIVMFVAGAMYVIQANTLEDLVSAVRFGGVEGVFSFVFLLFLAFIMWISYGNAITYNYYLLYVKKGAGKFSLQELFSASLSSTVPLLVANLILGTILLASMILFFTLGLFLGILGVLTTFALIFLGIYYGVRISFYPLIIVREKVNIFTAIKRSLNIIKGHWWQTFGLLVVFGIINYLISNITNTLLGFLGIRIFDPTVLVGGEIPQIGTIAIVLFVITQVVISVLSNMFSQTALFAQYGNLLEEKEGIGLKEKVEQIGKTSDNEKDEEDF
jgi:hypothetical protein